MNLPGFLSHGHWVALAYANEVRDRTQVWNCNRLKGKAAVVMSVTTLRADKFPWQLTCLLSTCSLPLAGNIMAERNISVLTMDRLWHLSVLGYWRNIRKLSEKIQTSNCSVKNTENCHVNCTLIEDLPLLTLCDSRTESQNSEHLKFNTTENLLS
jgi:hypothetical protein